MKLTLLRYSILLFFQFTFLFVDLMLNTFSYLFHHNKHLTFIMFGVQDFLIICEYVLFSFSLYSTCVYEVGASHIILKKCKLFLLTIMAYFLLSASHHCWIIYSYFMQPNLKELPTALAAVALIQRLIAPLYYHMYKRTAFKITDPRFHGNMDWIAEQLSIK